MSMEKINKILGKSFFKKRLYDWIFLAFTLLSIIYISFCGNKELQFALIVLNSLIAIGYYSYALRLFFFNRVSFDWHLVNGQFLRKVILLVIVTPFLLSFIFLLFEKVSGTNGDLYLLTNNEIAQEETAPKTMLLKVYYHFVEQGNQHYATGETQRWAFVTVLLGIFLFNGVLIASLIVWLGNIKEKYRNGLEGYESFLKRKDHYVIIGGNDMVIGIIKEIFKKQKKGNKAPYILIQTSSDVEEFRRQLFSNLKSDEQKHIIIQYGNRNSERDIKALCLNKAEEVFILGEESRIDDMESYHDTMNMKCLTLIYENIKNIEYFKKREEDKRLTIRFMFEYQAIFNVFKYSEIGEINERINFKPFYYYDMWAQKVLVCEELNKKGNYKYLPLEGINGIKKDDDNYVHLVVVGMTRIGTALATQAALIAHYPNYVTKKIRTKITLIDENADKEKDFYIDIYDKLFALSNWQYKEMVRGNDGEDKLETIYTHTPINYEHLGGDFLDIEWEFIKGNVAQLKLQKYIEECASNPAKMTIAICEDEPSKCLATALNLDWKIYEKVQQVLVYNRYDDALINKITHKMYGENFKAFGKATECYSINMFEHAEFIAKELDRLYRQTQKRVKELQSKEKEQQPRGKTETAEYWSNIYSANTLWTKLRCVDRKNGEINADDIEIIAKVEHNRWNIEQLIMSYRHLEEHEQEDVISNSKQENKYKINMAHFKICSNERLKVIADSSMEYDRKFVLNYQRIEKEISKNNIL